MNAIARFATTVHTTEIETNAQALEIDYYGNWGGPGHGSDGDVPIDRLDRAYMDHDHGYGKRGYFDAASDQIYGINTLGVLIDPKSTWSARLHGVGAVAIFGAMSPVSGFMTTVVNPLKSIYDDVTKHGLGVAAKNFIFGHVTKPLGIIKEGAAAIGGVLGTAAGLVGQGAAAVGGAISAGAKAVGNFFGSLF